MTDAFVELLDDPNPEVRTVAAEVLAGSPRASATPRLAAEFGGRDVRLSHGGALLRAISAANSALGRRFLEGWAQTAPSAALREDAARLLVQRTKPGDEAAELRRLLWERPDTPMEQQVMSRGRDALPLAWAALAGGADERRAAAALLGWIRDVKSIPPIVTALSKMPGALIREQLLFDLNLILLTEGAPADAAQSRALAAAHLVWVYEQIMSSSSFDSELAALVRGCSTIAVFSDQVPDGFSMQLGTATARRVQSGEAFRSAVAQNGCGMALHAISVAAATARVGATLYLPGRVNGFAWVAVYRRESDAWLRFETPNSPRVGWLIESSMKSAIWRDYGTDEPLKAPRLDLEMERVRVGGLAVHQRDGDWLGLATADVPLLERYRRSDSLDVRYVAEYEQARLTRRPNMSFWQAAFTASPGPLHEGVAIDVVRDYALRQVEARPGEATGVDRDRLVAAALAPRPMKPRLLPQRLPRGADIRRVRRVRRLRPGGGVVRRHRIFDVVQTARRRMGLLFIAASWIA